MQHNRNISGEHSKSRATIRMKKSRRLFILFGLISVLVPTYIVPTAEAGSSQADFDWQKVKFSRDCKLTDETKYHIQIRPAPDLRWVPCYGSRECARLEVPLDYSDPAGDKAAVALLRVKANVSSDSQDYRGPVLFNPGGPGGSGVLWIIQNGERFQQTLGNEYDIVGFDPRGVGATTPVVSAFADEVERSYWNAGAPPTLNSTPDALPQALFRSHLLSDLVEARSKLVAQHVSTAVVARDMLSITRAHGRDRLQYWGFSYGTVIGATFAGMFPDKIERMIIDGVVDPDDYYSGGWSRSLLDADKALQFFYDKCAAAGVACPLHANSSTMVQQRVENIMASMKTNPMPVVNGSEFGIIDFTAVKSGLFIAIHDPFTLFPEIAQALAALEQGDGRPGLTLLSMLKPLPKCNMQAPLGSQQEPGLAVFCGEANGLGEDDMSDIMQQFEKLSKQSIFADLWTDDIWTSCAGWKVRASERFAGPFTVNTSFPLLVIGNTADPATPLAGAQKAANTFGGSVLLTINTPGHTSHAATSSCVDNIVHDYFTQGKLPIKGTICEIEDVLFGENSTAGRARRK